MSNSSTLNDFIKENGAYISKTKGVSMNPFIKSGRDTVVVKDKEGRAKKGDVVLFKRSSGETVLHRVVKPIEKAYLICGDNQLRKELVYEEQVFGVLSGYFKRDRFIDCNSKAFKFKSRLWCFPPIKFFGVLTLRVIGKLKRMFKK